MDGVVWGRGKQRPRHHHSMVQEEGFRCWLPGDGCSNVGGRLKCIGLAAVANKSQCGMRIKSKIRIVSMLLLSPETTTHAINKCAFEHTILSTYLFTTGSHDVLLFFKNVERAECRSGNKGREEEERKGKEKCQ